MYSIVMFAKSWHHDPNAAEAPDQSGNTRDFHMSAVPLTEE